MWPAMSNNIPTHWRKGALLDLQRYADGSYRATLLGEEAKPELANYMEFDSSHTAQTFVSYWYARESVGGVYG